MTIANKARCVPMPPRRGCFAYVAARARAAGAGMRFIHGTSPSRTLQLTKTLFSRDTYQDKYLNTHTP
ncbi:hypothetical protein EVAR_6522_1 [Eumeta japonica]|uniref:Uncharacterized protein n=1 Tax=Eumeta variegata TaxID=151549 RepID=A0A4C1SQA2_EUMVA|nr:hypothetical protein EVAR_6522_1 [Eumeta japonica]